MSIVVSRAKHKWTLASRTQASKIEDPLMKCVRCGKCALESEVRNGHLGTCNKIVMP